LHREREREGKREKLDTDAICFHVHLWADSPIADKAEVEKSFWLSRPDGWVINRKMEKILLLEYMRAADSSESYYQDMWKVAEKQHTPILKGLRALAAAADREWEVEVVPLVVGQRSVEENECSKPLRFSGLAKKTGRGSTTD
jgi:hypothetical protein